MKIRLTIGLLFVFLSANFVLFVQPAKAADRPGVDCGCYTTGLYINPDKGKGLYKKILSVDEGSSKSGKYTYTTANIGGIFVLNVFTEGGTELVDIHFIPYGNVFWGFSPDEDRFVIHLTIMSAITL